MWNKGTKKLHGAGGFAEPIASVDMSSSQNSSIPAKGSVDVATSSGLCHQTQIVLYLLQREQHQHHHVQTLIQHMQIQSMIGFYQKRKVHFLMHRCTILP